MKIINVSITQLNEKLRKENKKLVCFGAGEMLQNFVRAYQCNGIQHKIRLILDNNKQKQDTTVALFSQNIDIVSVQRFCAAYDVLTFIVMISCSDVVGIYEQLQKIERLKDVECCILPFVRRKTNELEERNRYYPERYQLYSIPRIPKIIHYCWLGQGKIPEQNKIWMESWKKHCPDYEIVEWNEKNYDVSKNKYMHAAYRERKWGFVSDYMELDVIYHYGGIYLDTDVEIVKNLDELLYQDAFMGIDGTKLISLGLGFGAKPEFDLIRQLRDIYDLFDFYYPDGTMNLTSAPKLQRSFFENIGYKNNGEFQRIGGLSVYPEKVLSGKCNWTGMISPTEHTFAIHHYDGSWTSRKRKEQIIRMHEFYNALN